MAPAGAARDVYAVDLRQQHIRSDHKRRRRPRALPPRRHLYDVVCEKLLDETFAGSAPMHTDFRYNRLSARALRIPAAERSDAADTLARFADRRISAYDFDFDAHLHLGFLYARLARGQDGRRDDRRILRRRGDTSALPARRSEARGGFASLRIDAEHAFSDFQRRADRPGCALGDASSAFLVRRADRGGKAMDALGAEKSGFARRLKHENKFSCHSFAPFTTGGREF